MAIGFTSIPENGASYQKPLIYEFLSNTEVEQVEIKVLTNNGEEIARKVIHGAMTEGKIDIAPYVRRAVKYNIPENVTNCGVIDIGGSIAISVQIEDAISDERVFMAATMDLTKPITLLTDQSLDRAFTTEEFDMIGFLNTTTKPINVVIELCDDTYGCMTYKTFSSAEPFRPQAICVTPREFSEEFLAMAKYILVKLQHDGKRLDYIEYDIRENLSTARRIGWINEYGAPELYTFPMRKSILIEATRKHMESLWGREAAELESDNELKVISAYEPQKQLQALAKIVYSPKVWLQQGSGQQIVSLMTDRVLLTPGRGLGFVELDLRAAEKGVKLW